MSLATLQSAANPEEKDPMDTITVFDPEMAGQQDNRVGRVIAVSASEIVVLVEPVILADGTRSSPVIEMGTLVKVNCRNSTVYGMVSALRIPLPTIGSEERDLKIAELELVGETVADPATGCLSFRRGVSAFPALDDAIFMASPADLARVYARPSSVATAPIGTIHQDGNVPAYLILDDLLGKHFSIVGTTGTGKSCAVAIILRAVIERMPNAHILLLDPHNEYASAFGDRALLLSPRDGLQLPYWIFDFEEISEIVIGSKAPQPQQSKILAEAITAAKDAYFERLGREKLGTIDTPTPYRMSDVLRYLDNAMGKLDRSESPIGYQALKQRILALQSDNRYGFVFGNSLSLRDNMVEILSGLFRIPVEGKPVTILDMSGIPSEVVNVVVSVLCRLAFDFSLWSDSPVPTTIICEEAHRYAPRDKDLGFELAKRALSRIAKEGRKYGVSLCVVSQRPSDLAPGLISECNTMFAMRMNNHDDQEIVRNAVPESSVGLMQFLPALRNGEAIAVGEGVSMPMRICFAPLPEFNRPNSATACFTRAWSEDRDGRAEISATIERWRRGQRYSAA